MAIGPLAAQVARAEVRGDSRGLSAGPQPAQVWSGGRQYRRHLPGCAHRGTACHVQITVPTIRVIGVIYDPEKTGALVKEAGEMAERFGLRFLATPVASQTEVPAALRSLLGKVDALWMLPDETVITPESLTFFLLTAFKHNLPVLTISDAFVEAGALAALSARLYGCGSSGVPVVQGDREWPAAARRRPVLSHRPRSTSLINLQTAGQLGLVLPPEIVQSASKVYQ